MIGKTLSNLQITATVPIAVLVGCGGATRITPIVEQLWADVSVGGS